MSGHSSHGGGHEPDLGFNQVMLIIPFSMLLLVGYVVVCWFSGSASLSREMARKQAFGAVMLHKPLEAFRAHEDSSLHQYAVEKDKGTVQIPIDRAMEMMAHEAAQPAEAAKGKAK